MTIAITQVLDGRGREGDLFVVIGTGFSATPGANLVTVDGVQATVLLDTTTGILAVMPALTNRDRYVAVVVQFEDGTLDNDVHRYWSKPTLAEMQTVSVPGQVPGPNERVDRAQADVAEAKDYEGAVTLAEYLLREVLTTRGDLFARDSGGIARLPVGGGGNALGARSTEPTGLEWTRTERGLTLLWARSVVAGETTLLAMVANGDQLTTSTSIGEHGAPFDGIIEAIWCFVNDTGGGDTLDQVTVERNGSTVYNSGTGLGLTQNQSHRVTGQTLVCRAGDRLVLKAKKLGGTNAARLSGGVRLVQRVAEPSDAVVVVDTIARSMTAPRSAGADTIAVSDTVVAVKL